MKKYHAHRIDKQVYEYRGFRIECVGYYNPDHKIAWEAVDKDGYGFAHAFTLRECKMWVDYEIEKNQENNEEN